MKPFQAVKSVDFLSAQKMNRIRELTCFGSTCYVLMDNISLCEGKGESMLPTLNARGDFMLMERVSVKLNLIKAGDIVVSRNPWELTGEGGSPLICKRVVAIGGQKLPIADNFFTRLLGKDFLSRFQTPLPLNSVWLEGDNSTMSTDSRQMGCIPTALLQGRVIARLYPDFRLFLGEKS